MTIQDQTEPVPAAAGAPSPGHGFRTGRWPATAVFFLNGLALSTYIVRMPSLKSAHHLTDGQVGLMGALFAAAALTSMQFVGPLVARVGNRALLRGCLAVLPVLLAGVGLAGGLVGFAVAVTALGAVHGATDAAMNAHAVTIERRAERPVLNGCHAAWSISAVVASLAASVTSHAGVSVGVYFGVAGLVLLVGGLALGPFLLPTEASRETPPASVSGSGRGRRRFGWSGTVIALGLTGTVLMICEGAALGWSAIFLHDNRGASLGLAAVAVTAYTGGQAVGRVFGDRLTARYRLAPVFRTGGVIAAAGLALAVLAPSAPVAVVGFAVAGIGASVLIPLAFSAVGQTDTNGLGAAALIGAAAEFIGLTSTLAALIPLLLAAALTSPLPRSR